MKFPHCIAALFAASCLSISIASADPKPSGSKQLDKQSIANYYAGKSEVWKSCKGGVYYGGAWEAQAYCNKDGESVGVGKWSVKNGSICHTLTWSWPKGDGVGSKEEKPDCRYLAVAPDGVIWMNWGDRDKSAPKPGEWWKLENQDGIVKGFKEKRKVSKLRKKLSV